MIYASACSGIEAATVAWHGLGWSPAWFSEIEKFPSAVLRHHYPSVPNLGDLNRAHEHADFGRRPVDLLVGGTPCQSFSVAGLREGLRDPRGNLALVYLGIAERLRPRWVLWENVPGVLSSSGGRDFGAFLGALAKLGYGFSYRVLDAQYFGLAQRRKRVFVVGYLGDWRRAAAVLLERESLQGNPPPSREAGKETAPTLAARTRGGGGLGTDTDLDGGLILSQAESVALRGRDGGGTAELGGPLAHALRASTGGGDKAHVLAPVVSPTLRAGGNRTGGDRPPGTDVDTCDSLIVAPTLRGRIDRQHDAQVVSVFDPTQITSKTNRSQPTPGLSHTLPRHGHPPVAFHATQDPDVSGDITHPIGAKDRGLGVDTEFGVRRLTPTECERLQGFPDGYTLIPYTRTRKGLAPAKDGPRYKALGNTMAVAVMEWIGQRIQMVDEITKQKGRGT